RRFRRGSIAARPKRSETCSRGSRPKDANVWRRRMTNEPRKSPQTEIDLTSIWDFIARDNVRAADSLLVRIEAAFNMLAANPLAGRARDDLAPAIRSFPVGNYIIFYLPRSDGIEVVRVLHGRQDIVSDDMR